MKRRLLFLYGRDHNFDRVLTEARLGIEAVVFMVPSFPDSLQTVYQCGRGLDFALTGFDDGLSRHDTAQRNPQLL